MQARASIDAFQCSSASRKFLNQVHSRSCVVATPPFQCSSASRKFLNHFRERNGWGDKPVSVLFSEPKIPQFLNASRTSTRSLSFSALQRAENSSIPRTACSARLRSRFQCSSASRKFLNREVLRARCSGRDVSVLFSEPKIPQSRPSHLRPSIFPTAMITLRHS